MVDREAGVQIGVVDKEAGVRIGEGTDRAGTRKLGKKRPNRHEKLGEDSTEQAS